MLVYSLYQAAEFPRFGPGLGSGFLLFGSWSHSDLVVVHLLSTLLVRYTSWKAGKLEWIHTEVVPPPEELDPLLRHRLGVVMLRDTHGTGGPYPAKLSQLIVTDLRSRYKGTPPPRPRGLSSGGAREGRRRLSKGQKAPSARGAEKPLRAVAEIF